MAPRRVLEDTESREVSASIGGLVVVNVLNSDDRSTRPAVGVLLHPFHR